MLLRLDPRSDKPIYLQIADLIAAQIDAGSPKAGERLPSARSLGETLGVNMHTVLKAYSELEGRSLVEMRRGRGGVVVTESVKLVDMTKALVSVAKHQRVGKEGLVEMVREAWQ